ncbi:hypothetical protein TNCV_1871841 [Trichonephila clavipes]|nr:hypothetical protein TNCV_1871841 [Trichonephila clavipes]
MDAVDFLHREDLPTLAESEPANLGVRGAKPTMQPSRRRGRGALPWIEKKKTPCPGSRKHERRALVGTDWKRALKKRTWSEIGVERKERR